MASKRLTKDMRYAFVRAAMQDVPKPDEEVCNKEFNQILYNEMPPQVKAVYDLDPAWLEQHSIEVDADWNVRQQGISDGLKEMYRVTGNFYLHYRWYKWGEENLPAVAVEYKEKLDNILTDRIKLMIKLWGISQACSTVAQLKEALPELEKYMPMDEPAAKKNVPVIANLMADVVKLGWPGGKIVNATIQLPEAA